MKSAIKISLELTKTLELYNMSFDNAELELSQLNTVLTNIQNAIVNMTMGNYVSFKNDNNGREYSLEDLKAEKAKYESRKLELEEKYSNLKDEYNKLLEQYRKLEALYNTPTEDEENTTPVNKIEVVTLSKVDSDNKRVAKIDLDKSLIPQIDISKPALSSISEYTKVNGSIIPPTNTNKISEDKQMQLLENIDTVKEFRTFVEDNGVDYKSFLKDFGVKRLSAKKLDSAKEFYISKYGSNDSEDMSENVTPNLPQEDNTTNECYVEVKLLDSDEIITIKDSELFNEYIRSFDTLNEDVTNYCFDKYYTLHYSPYKLAGSKSNHMTVQLVNERTGDSIYDELIDMSGYKFIDDNSFRLYLREELGYKNEIEIINFSLNCMRNKVDTSSSDCYVEAKLLDSDEIITIKDSEFFKQYMSIFDSLEEAVNNHCYDNYYGYHIDNSSNTISILNVSNDSVIKTMQYDTSKLESYMDDDSYLKYYIFNNLFNYMPEIEIIDKSLRCLEGISSDNQPLDSKDTNQIEFNGETYNSDSELYNSVVNNDSDTIKDSL